MAVGDVVSAIGAPNAVLDFQPAAGVEVIITGIFNDGQAANIYSLFDGAVNSNVDTADAISVGALKIMFNNALYLRCGALGGVLRSAFCGIEINI